MTNKELQEKLFVKKESSWYNEENQKNAFTFCDEYKLYIDNSKTERLCVDYSIEMLKKAGFKNITDFTSLSAGDKFFKNIKGRALLAGIAGKNMERFNIVGAHVDSPRLDTKPNPLYEDSGLALLQTHYYGGVKKYQWVNQPLSLHGLVITRDGKEINLSIGERDDEPKFIIPDLLIHLSQEQMTKTASKVVEAEDLNVLVGHIPVNDKDIKEQVKFAVLKKLHEEYGIVEEDLTCADLTFTPAGKAMDIGLDRALIAAYGHDDRICAFPALKVITDMETPETTALVFLSDKEEVGSIGDSGADSNILINFTLKYQELAGLDKDAHFILEDSAAISSDVTAGVNPNFKGVHEAQNAAYLGKGVGIAKYTGARGKSGAHDCHAVFANYIRRICLENDVPFQIVTMGRLDLGGGGTIAKFLSAYGMDVIDAGPAVMAMHAPYEVASKIDIYSCYRLYKAFMEK